MVLALVSSACVFRARSERRPASWRAELEAREPGMPISAAARDQLIADVVASRGLARLRPIPVIAVSAEALASSYRERFRASGARWLDLADTADDHVDAQVARTMEGYFDTTAERVVVIASSTTDPQRLDAWRMSLAHEVQHALQHQHFGAFAQLAETSDESLARRALREGDAEVTASIYLARRRGEPHGRALGRLIDRRGREALRLAHLDGEGHLAAERDVRLWFPYISGAAFAAQLHQAGGFDVIDRAHDAPPTTTEQVLHPEKFLAGERPRLLPEPPAPSGHHALRRDRLGELGAWLLLARCNPTVAAREAAAGWDGDRYLLASSAEGHRVEIWDSHWDRPRDAREAEWALRAWPCAGDERGALVVRRGRRVVAIAGLDALQRRQLALRVLASR